MPNKEGGEGVGSEVIDTIHNTCSELAQECADAIYWPHFIAVLYKQLHSRSPKVGNPIASILKSHIEGILNPVSNLLELTIDAKKLSGFGSISVSPFFGILFCL